MGYHVHVIRGMWHIYQGLTALHYERVNADCCTNAILLCLYTYIVTEFSPRYRSGPVFFPRTASPSRGPSYPRRSSPGKGTLFPKNTRNLKVTLDPGPAPRHMSPMLQPVYDTNGNIQLYDMFLMGRWLGSRRTVEQCLEVLEGIGVFDFVGHTLKIDRRPVQSGIWRDIP